MKFGYHRSMVSGKKSFESVDGRRRTTEPSVAISSPGNFGSGELKAWIHSRRHKFYPLFMKLFCFVRMFISMTTSCVFV